MNKFVKWFYKILVIWGILLMGAVTVSIIASVILRYVFGIVFVWAEEVITLLFIGTTYFGAIICMREDEHIFIDFFIEKFSKRVQYILKLLVLVIIIAVQAFVLKMSFFWIEKTGSAISPGVRIPVKYYYYMLPISCILIIIYALIKIFFPFDKKGQLKEQ
ncbi:TRAP transporter small permease [bacterium]|nr:TRAP transporter small permease [bacterium]